MLIGCSVCLERCRESLLVGIFTELAVRFKMSRNKLEPSEAHAKRTLAQRQKLICFELLLWHKQTERNAISSDATVRVVRSVIESTRDLAHRNRRVGTINRAKMRFSCLFTAHEMGTRWRRAHLHSSLHSLWCGPRPNSATTDTSHHLITLQPLHTLGQSAHSFARLPID